MEQIPKCYRYYKKKEQYHKEYYQIFKERIKKYQLTYFIIKNYYAEWYVQPINTHIYVLLLYSSNLYLKLV